MKDDYYRQLDELRAKEMAILSGLNTVRGMIEDELARLLRAGLVIIRNGKEVRVASDTMEIDGRVIHLASDDEILAGAK